MGGLAGGAGRLDQLDRRAARRAGGEGGVPLRCAGALCRRSAAIVARGVPGRRNPKCDVGRDQGGLRVVPLATAFAARLAAETTTFAFCCRVVRFDGVALDFTSHDRDLRSEEHTSELQSLLRISYAVFCLNKKKKKISTTK